MEETIGELVERLAQTFPDHELERGGMGCIDLTKGEDYIAYSPMLGKAKAKKYGYKEEFESLQEAIYWYQNVPS